MVLLIVRIVRIVGQVGIVALESPVSLVVMTGVVGSDLGRGYEARDRGGKGKTRPNLTIADQYTFARG